MALDVTYQTRGKSSIIDQPSIAVEKEQHENVPEMMEPVGKQWMYKGSGCLMRNPDVEKAGLTITSL